MTTKKLKNMKMSFKTLALITALAFVAIPAVAQEIVTPFHSTEKAPVRRNVAEARFLPFFDDFSRTNT